MWEKNAPQVEDVERLKARVKELESLLDCITGHRDALLHLVEAAPVAIVTLNTEGLVTSWNPMAERIFGWSAQEAIGGVVPFVPQDQFVHFIKLHEQQLDTDEPIQEVEVQRSKKDGSAIDIRVSTALMRSSGKVQQVIGAIADITERKNAERALQELNQTLEQKVEDRTEELREAVADLESFTYSISHDLRSPLRAISGYTQAIQEDYDEALDEEGQDYLNRVLRNTQRMSQLIDDLLDFSRTSRKSLHLTTTDMKALAREVADELSEDREVEVVVEDLPPAKVDPSLFRQVFVNLISNGIKYSSKEGQSRVVVGYQDSAYFVRDNGVGFDMQFAHKLFGVFSRLHRDSEFEGTGVGLAIVARVLSRHGGRVWAEAELGQGATFYFTLQQAQVE